MNSPKGAFVKRDGTGSRKVYIRARKSLPYRVKRRRESALALRKTQIAGYIAELNNATDAVVKEQLKLKLHRAQVDVAFLEKKLNK